MAWGGELPGPTPRSYVQTSSKVRRLALKSVSFQKAVENKFVAVDLNLQPKNFAEFAKSRSFEHRF